MKRVPACKGPLSLPGNWVVSGVPCTVIVDGASGLLMRRGEVDAVLVGCDRVAANGDVANKIGTYNLALVAQAHGIPFYVCAPGSSIDRATVDGDAITIEERDAEEITHVKGCLLYTSPSPRDMRRSRMPSSA